MTSNNLSSGLGQMLKQYFISPTFCVYPWMEFMMGPKTQMKVCCIAEELLRTRFGKIYETDRFSLEEIWNGYGMREIRKKMLAGKKVRACGHCYYQESVGQTSYRESFNLEWLNGSFGKEIIRRVKFSQINSGKVDSPPLYLDIRPDNLCNLKCRMCDAGSSSKIYQEQKELLEERKEEIAPLIKTSYFSKDMKFFRNYIKSPKLRGEILSWLPKVKRLYFTGGEPTLIQYNWELLDYVKQRGWSKNIYLDFNINCTHIPDKLLDTFDNFRGVSLNLSIDGYGKVQEYIRHPSRWNVIEANVRKILNNKTGKVSIYFTFVVQAYNVLNLTEFLNWFDDLQEEFEHTIHHSWNFCTVPSFLDIAILPQNVRNRASEKIREYQNTYQGSDSFLIECLESIQNILKTKFKNSKKNLRQLYQYTRILDEKRGESFEKALPELNQLLNEDGNWNSLDSEY